MPCQLTSLILKPEIVYSGVSITPDNGVAIDFSAPVIYTVFAENETTRKYTVTISADTISPGVTLTSTTLDPTNVSPIDVQAVFDEEVTGLLEAEISVANGTVDGGSLITVDNITYDFTVTPSANGVTVSVQIPAGAAQDSVINGNTASNILTREYDCYTHRRPIVINYQKVGLDDIGTLPATGFPVLISLSGNWLKTTAADPVNGRIQNGNCYDIVFRESDGTTPLYHEIETYDGNNGTLAAWVRIDYLSKSADTTIYICYGNADITSPTESPNNVWDADFAGVWHLKESGNGTAGEFKDSTVNINHATGGSGDSGKTPALVTGTTAKIGNAQDFDGINDYINAGNSSTLMPASITVSAWVKREGPSDGTAWQDIVGNQSYDGTYSGYLLFLNPENTGATWRVLGDNNVYNLGPAVTTSEWHLYTGTFSGTTSRIYVDGTLRASLPAAAMGISTMNIYIGDHGSYTGGGSGLFDGLIDEVQISGAARSDDWIITSYNNQSDTAIGADKFIKSLGAEE